MISLWLGTRPRVSCAAGKDMMNYILSPTEKVLEKMPQMKESH